MTPLSVTQLNTQIKALLESHFLTLHVEGEISNFTAHTSGHLYFSIKDENSSIRCVMFKGNATRLKFKPHNGMKIIASCGLSVYTPRGEYQLICEALEPAGLGSLKVAFEQLKQKLTSKGYFSPELKKQIPKFPKKIALITSATGAALQDMSRVAMSRWKLTHFTLFNTLVQGEGSKEQICKNIELADSMGFDCIILARGGGSIEDLWAFNEEVVADAIYIAKTPIVSAIGHEIDYLISDYVADLRAPTPSAAMEMVLPDEKEIQQFLDDILNTLGSRVKQILSNFTNSLRHTEEILNTKSPKNQINFKLQESRILNEQLRNLLQQKIKTETNELRNIYQNLKFETRSIATRYSNEVQNLQRSLTQLNPENFSNENYPMLVKDGKKALLSSLKNGDKITLQTSSATAEAEIYSLSKLGK